MQYSWRGGVAWGAMPCYAVLCCAMLCYDVLYCAMLCYAVAWVRVGWHVEEVWWVAVGVGYGS